MPPMPPILRRLARSPALVPLLLSVATLAVLIRFDRPLIRGDGVAYAAWVDTLVRDGDIKLANQAGRFSPVNSYQITWDEALGRYVNIFPFGAAILHAPGYALGGALVESDLANQNPDYFRQHQGVEQGYSLMVMAGANVMALLTVLLAWALARRFTDRWTAALLAWGFLVGTPLLYYSSVMPLNSHNPGAFLVALLLWLSARYTPVLGSDAGDAAPTPRAFWVALGVTGGLMVLVRWQLLLVAALVWGWLLWHSLEKPPAARRRDWRGLALATALAALVLIPLPLVWNAMFGDPFVVPYDESSGEAFFSVPDNAHRVLGRMLHYSPILALSLVGLVAAWRVDRKLAVFAAATIAAQLLINGSTKDWYAGDSFGARRMSELFALYVLLAAALAGRIPRRLQAWRALIPVASRVALVALIAYSIFFFYVFLLYTWTNPAGLFAHDPDVMLGYYWDHPTPRATLDAVLEAHVGPAAWDEPGP